jgi:tetratricopeptide (TPR) repeat protein
LLEQGKRDAESSGLALYHSRLTLWMGEALMRADRLDDAQAQAERARALTRERGERGLEAWALWLLGEVVSRREPVDRETAEGHYLQGIALAEDVGLRPLVARSHDGLGKLYRRVGKHETAQEHLSTAITMYRRMGMKFWLEQAEAELAALS